MSTILDRLAMVGNALRRDGWVNTLTGLGDRARDKLLATVYGRSPRMSETTLEELFHTNDMAARIVEKIVDDALRVPFCVKFEAKDGEDLAALKDAEEAARTELERLQALEKVAEAATWGRLYGGGSVFVLMSDGLMPWEPVQPERIKSVDSLLVLDARDHWPVEWGMDRTKPGFDEPSMYQISTTSQNGRSNEHTRVHATRLITFGGQRTGMRRKMENNGWSASVLERPNEALRHFGVSWQAIAHLMTDSAQGVFKMKDLISAISANAPETLRARMQTVEMARSVARAVLLDADSESFERQEITFTGHAQMMDKVALRLAAAADMPVTVLFGQSPAGMNATGENDRGLWDERVQAYQTHVLHSRIKRLATLMLSAKAGPTSGRVPDKLKVEFPPLRQMTDKERADIRKVVADTDAVYIDRLVVTPEEVASSRFTEGGGWSPDMHVDLELRAKIMEADKQVALEEAKNPKPKSQPPAPPAPPAPGTQQPPAEDEGDDDDESDEDDDEAQA